MRAADTLTRACLPPAVRLRQVLIAALIFLLGIGLVVAGARIIHG